jgi:adenylate kinase
VFVTGISGSGTGEYLQEVDAAAAGAGHEHPVRLFDVGTEMHASAEEYSPGVQWDYILDADPKMLGLLRGLAFERLGHEIELNPETLFIVDLHLAFRWRAYLTQGFGPRVLQAFAPRVRCFINLVEDIHRVQERLAQTTWGKRRVLELLIWRDEELFLTGLFSEICRVDHIAVARGEPASVVERLIWHPEMRRVYLSFPITNIKDDPEAMDEIRAFLEEIREFLIVFDPFACRDYDETYERPEMMEFRKEVGETTLERDFRFIDQADAIVVYFPVRVDSKGVDAEMNHAQRTGKPIFRYSPEDLGGGPFAVPPNHQSDDRTEFVDILRDELG